MQFSPAFSAIMTKLATMPASELTSDKANWLFQLAHKHAPAEFINLVVKQAQAEGMFPLPTHCDDDGNALYSLEELAAHFGKTPDEAQEALQKMLTAEPELAGHLHSGPAHRLQ